MTACQRKDHTLGSSPLTDLDLVWQMKRSVCSDRVIARPDQAVDLIVLCSLGVGVAVLRQRLAGVPVAGQTFLIQMNVHGGVQLR